MEFSELFTQCARELRPLARSKNLVSYFDYHGPLIEVPSDTAALHCGIHRVMRGLIDCIDSGFITFNSIVASPEVGRCKVLVHASGTGASEIGRVQNILDRLQLESLPPVGAGFGGSACNSEGICPATGGKVIFANDGVEGLRMSLEVQLSAIEHPTTALTPDAAGAQAWLVSAGLGGLDSVSRRLRRSGWHVRSFESIDQVSALMATGVGGNGSLLPMLLVVAETNGSELPEMERIAAMAPALWTVLAVVVGSRTVKRRGTTPVDIRVLPLSPLELDHMTAHVDGRTSTAISREAAPPPLYVQDRKLILVVDDNDINQTIADAMLDVLGYDVALAHNGIEALDRCRCDPPDLILMDLEMPNMGGLEATERLREWQQVATVPPFPIVAATSSQDDGVRKACLRAGMDGHLLKPLDLRRLADEIHRMLPTRPVSLFDDRGIRQSR